MLTLMLMLMPSPVLGNGFRLGIGVRGAGGDWGSVPRTLRRKRRCVFSRMGVIILPRMQTAALQQVTNLEGGIALNGNR